MIKGKIEWYHSKPDGRLRKHVDITLMKEMGFIPKITIREGIIKTIEEYKALKNIKGLAE